MRYDPSQESARVSNSRRSLKRDRRITRSKMFEEVLERGRRAVGRLMVMVVCPSDDARSRVGVVAGKRTFRRAVDRSRVKRLLREAYRLHRHELAEGYNMVLVARRALAEACRMDAEEELLHLARRLSISAGKETETFVQ